MTAKMNIVPATAPRPQHLELHPHCDRSNFENYDHDRTATAKIGLRVTANRPWAWSPARPRGHTALRYGLVC